MSSTATVCQGLQSCLDLEPLVIEPRVILHQLAPSKQAPSSPWPHKQTENPHPVENKVENNEKAQELTNSWSFITSPSFNNCKKLTDDQEQVYIHPLLRRSSSSLSPRSLEMCTESLCSETGDVVDPNAGEYSYNSLQKQTPSKIRIPRTRDFHKKVSHSSSSSSFPPPLTSISGNDGVQVRAHRESGRLVIKAFNYSSCKTCFQTERRNGRLRLSLVKDCGQQEVADDDDDEQKKVDEADQECRDDENEMRENEYKACLWSNSSSSSSSSNRCNGDDRIRNNSKRLPSLPYCVAIS